ncbi:MAG: CehA/McbA family metallohydrolase [Planctomycetes bacterium]|nr:CehA/McbA family metallohydrolase [Planctomycetota bacterium]
MSSRYSVLTLPTTLVVTLALGVSLLDISKANALPKVTDIDFQPVGVQLQRLQEAMAYLGEPFSEETVDALRRAEKEESQSKALEMVQEVLDPLCLLDVQINPESRVKVRSGPAKRRLVEQGWSVFLVKVRNTAGVTAELEAKSEQAIEVRESDADQLRDRWLELDMFGGRPLNEKLSGVGLEYRIIQLYSRDAGKRSAVISFHVGQGTQDLGFRSDETLTFDCASATPVTINVTDENGEPTTASFEIRDSQQRVYPAQSKRVAPDFGFHPQIYRADGEEVLLPVGKYHVVCRRGPEYLLQEREVEITEQPSALKFELRRWIDPAASGWWSGDHHIHAAGCSHYAKPSEGVHAPDMMRHCLGEDLKIGCNLTWGPCFDYQKQFFTGKDDAVSVYPYLLRYDVEVSGFGSSQSGHLCLLRLKEQIPEGGDSKDHWPKLCLNTLRWAKKQGAICGPAHSGWGLTVETQELPNYVIPPFDGIGANEYIVDVTHLVEGPNKTRVPAVDFMAMVDTPYTWETNIWYHTLNCGFRTRISGETDFPCIYDERVGLGRSYVKLDGRLSYDAWCEGIRRGAAYVSDGRSHLLDFQLGDVELGVDGSELLLDAPTTVTAKATVASLLNEKVEAGIKERPFSNKPYWHLERARIDGTRKVPVELIVNGYAVARKEIVADGSAQEVTFDVPIKQSSWVALRIEASSHTNPIFVLVDDKPIRASRRSAQWCLDGVNQCWSQKEQFIAKAEMDDAVEAYSHAREAYRQILSESKVE